MFILKYLFWFIIICCIMSAGFALAQFIGQAYTEHKIKRDKPCG